MQVSALLAGRNAVYEALQILPSTALIVGSSTGAVGVATAASPLA